MTLSVQFREAFDIGRVEAYLTRALEILPGEALVHKRWFADKGRSVERISLRDVCTVSDALPAALLSLVEVRFADGTTSVYQIPWVLAKNRVAESPGNACWEVLFPAGVSRSRHLLPERRHNWILWARSDPSSGCRI